MIAPFWANFDTRMGGTVSWELHTRENSFSLVDLVDAFIAGEYGDTSFAGSWMLVANWKNVQPSLLTQVTTIYLHYKFIYKIPFFREILSKLY